MRYLFIALIISFSASCQTSSSEKTVYSEKNSSVRKLILSPKEFSEAIKHENDLQLIDVRTPNEFNQGSIAKSKNMNILDGTFEKGVSSLDKAKPIYVYCAKGGRSRKAADLLEEKGFTNIIDLRGGYTLYKEEIE